MSEPGKNSAGDKVWPGGKNDVSISSCAYLLFTLWTLLLIIDRLTLSSNFQSFFQSGMGMGVSVIFVLLALAGAWFKRKRLFQIMTAKAFAVAIMVWLLAFAGLGTFFIQTGSEEELIAAYGPRFSGMVFLAGVNDIFHSLWFGGFLILLALSLTLVVIKRRSWRFPDWGNLFSHLGVVLILLGGFIGHFFGFKGFMGLYVGKASNQVSQASMGIKTEQLKELDFSVLLEDFQIELYEPVYNIYLYQGDGDSFQVKRVYDLKKNSDWNKVDGSGLKFRLVNIYPDYSLQTELKESPNGKGLPAIRVDLNEGQAEKTAVLFAATAERQAITILPQGLQARFFWEPRPLKEITGAYDENSPSHVIVFEKSDCCPRQEIEVKPGGKYLVSHGGLYELKVLDYFPDFTYDLGSRKAQNRSRDPKNPALHLEITETATNTRQERWLFAKVPEFGKTHGMGETGPGLTYRFRASSLPPEKELVLIGKTREAVVLENGKEKNRFQLPAAGQPIPGTNISSFKIFASAELVQKPESRSGLWNNPMVELEVKQGTITETRFLPAGKGQYAILPDERYALALKSNPDDVKSFRSKLAVLKNDRKIFDQTVSVNHPLHFQGYGFYQSKYNKDDPAYSGILVDKDPGLWLVWTGFGMVCAGLVFVFYLKPIFISRRMRPDVS